MMLSKEDIDTELLKDLVNKDIKAFEKVFVKYNKKIFGFALMYLKNKEEAEGVVQEVFLSLWTNCKNLRKDSNLDAWLFTVTYNVIRKKFSKLSKEKNKLKEYHYLNSDNSREISDIEYYDLLAKANHIIEKLPKQQKTTFLLHKEKDYSVSDIASHLNVSKRTVENHLYRARLFIKESMKEEGLISMLFFVLFIR